MGNVNIQGNVPLAGRGLITSRSGKYGAGEYRRLMDVEIDSEGHLISRRPIKSVFVNTYNDMVDPRGFIGNWGSSAVVADLNGVYTKDETQELSDIRIWKMSDVPNDATSGGIKYSHTPIAFYHYNNIDHMVTFRIKSGANDAITYHVYTRGNGSNVPVAVGSEFSGFADHTVLTSGVGNVNPMYTPVTTLVHKDRLWIATSSVLYFSKPTDFTNFTAPDGGFFKFNEQEINDVIAVKDSIYVICDSAVFVITYSTDPNVDATSRKLSDGVGGDSACIYEDVPYFIKGPNLYAINGLSVVKALDLNLDLIPGDSDPDSSGKYLDIRYKITSFGDYLVIMPYFKYRYSQALEYPFGITPAGGYYPPTKFARQSLYAGFPTKAPAESFPSLYFLNMTNGAMHGVMYRDQYGGSFWDSGFPIDFIATPVENPKSDFNLYILTNKVTWGGGAISTGLGYVYYMKRNTPDFSKTPALDDITWYPDGKQVRTAIQSPEVEITSFAPDGNEYLMKKFRSLEIMGKLPADSFNLTVGFDDKPANVPLNVLQMHRADEVVRPPWPIRAGINQRARSLTVHMELDSGADFENVDQDLAIVDIRTLWGYTKRGVIRNDKYDTRD